MEAVRVALPQALTNHCADSKITVDPMDPLTVTRQSTTASGLQQGATLTSVEAWVFARLLYGGGAIDPTVTTQASFPEVRLGHWVRVVKLICCSVLRAS